MAAPPTAWPTPVCAGQVVTVVLAVTNTGQATALNVLPAQFPAIAGTAGAVLATAPPLVPSLPGGASVLLTWTFSTTSPGTVAFTVSATGADANSGAARTTGLTVSTPATVNAAGALSIAAIAPAAVSVGQWMTVRLTVTNAGTADVTGVTPALALAGAPLAVNAELGPLPAGPVTLVAGAAVTFVWTYSAAGSGVVDFTASVAGSTCAAMPLAGALTRTVTVQTPAALAAALAPSASILDLGFALPVVITLTNTGQAALTWVPVPVLSWTGTGAVTVSGPSGPPITVPAGGSVSWTWIVTAVSPGSVSFSATVAGADANSGAPLSLVVASAAPLVLGIPNLMMTAFTVSPANPAIRDLITVTMTVSDTGTVALSGVSPSALMPTGTAPLVLVSGPATTVLTLQPGETGTFTWTYQATGEGTVGFAGSAASASGAATPVVATNIVTVPAAAGGSGNLADLIVFPIPFNPATAQGGMLKFQRMPAGTEVRLYNAAGELTRFMLANGLGSIEWDGRNDGGSPVASGLYYFVAKAPGGESRRGKVWLVR